MINIKNNDIITMAHGEGGKLSRNLIKEIFLKAYNNEYLELLDDGAILPKKNKDIVVSTDSYIISPHFFPGGDIGELAVNGTANDISMMGAKPEFITLSLIIEEGYSVEKLEIITESIAKTASNAGIKIVTGDTKVAPRGTADGIYINTSGIGYKKIEITQKFQPRDKIIVSGTIGDHSAAILIARGDYKFKSDIKSDTCFLWPAVDAVSKVKEIKFLRDITRGGLAENLNDIVINKNFGIRLFEEHIPVKENVKAVCDLLGYDPLYLANEGKFITIVPEECADETLSILKTISFCRDSEIIGEITNELPGIVSLKTIIGTERVVDSRTSIQLPRIC